MGVKLQLKVKVEAAALLHEHLQERYRIYNSLFLSITSRLKVKERKEPWSNMVHGWSFP
jgi:hypothetical protein